MRVTVVGRVVVVVLPELFVLAEVTVVFVAGFAVVPGVPFTVAGAVVLLVATGSAVIFVGFAVLVASVRAPVIVFPEGVTGVEVALPLLLPLKLLPPPVVPAIWS